MNRKETLNHPLCPDWLKKADWEGYVELRETWPYVVFKYGIWKDGFWEFGTWEGGTWKDGIWKDGIWEDGFKRIGQCKWSVYYSKDFIKIGCKTKTTREWIDWFNRDEEFETPRDSEAFKQIYKTFLIAKAAQEIEFGDES